MHDVSSSQTAEVTWPIRYQLLLPNLGVLGLVVVGAALLGAFWAGSRADQAIHGRLCDMAETLSNSSFPLTDAVLEQVRELTGATLAVTDEQGAIRYGSQDVRPIFARSLPAPPKDLDEVSAVDEVYDVADAAYLHCTIMVPMRPSDVDPTTLHVLVPKTLWWQAVASAVWPPMLVGLIGAGCGIPAGLRLAWKMSTRIERLRVHMSRLAAGEFGQLTVEGPADELRSLAVAGNELSDQLHQLRQAIQRHERLSLVGQLSAGLLHQLRNCAAGARLALKIHRKHCDRADQESLDVAERQLDLLSDHVQRYLVMRPDEQPAPAVCQLNDVLRDVSRLLDPTFRHRRVRLTRNAPGADATLRVGSENLRHLLCNLLTNAADAAGAGGEVRLDVNAADFSVVRFRVTDTGPGLPPELATQAFEPFVTTKPEGIGLGLVICRRIAEDCGGELRLENVPGACCFEAVIPRAAGGPPTEVASPVEASA